MGVTGSKILSSNPSLEDITNTRYAHAKKIKKGQSRGGHYHTNVVNHHVLRGKIMYKEIRLTKNGKIKKNQKESKKIVSGGKVITTPPYAAHIFFGLENSIIFEASGGKKKSITYQPYREQIRNL